MKTTLSPLNELMDEKSLTELLDNFYGLMPKTICVLDCDGVVLARSQFSTIANDFTTGYLQRIRVDHCEPFSIWFDGDAVPSAIEQTLIESVALKLRQKITESLARRQPLPVPQTVAQQDEFPFHLRDILKFSPTAISWANTETGEIEFINPAFERLFGYAHDDIPSLRVWLEKAFPDEEYRNEVLMPWYIHTERPTEDGKDFRICNLQVTCKNGKKRHVVLHVTHIGSRRLVNYSDISDYVQVQSRLKVHGEILEGVARGDDLDVVLSALVDQVQSESPHSICSVLLMDDNETLNHFVANGLPDFYTQAINGLRPGPMIGSCGRAAYLKERVIVEDIHNSEYWKGAVELTDKAGLRACWSDPILSSAGKVLGTFAIYHPYPTKPSETDIDLIGFASNIASIAIENRRTQKELEQRAYFDHLTGLANRGHFFERAEQALQDAMKGEDYYCMVMLDVDHFKMVNDQHGHKVGDKVLIAVANVMSEVIGDIGYIGRIGGEEFAIMLPMLPKQGALTLAERICDEVSNLTIYGAVGEAIQITISAGVSQCCEEDESAISLERLFGRADQALYQAKAAGRNRAEVFSKKCC